MTRLTLMQGHVAHIGQGAGSRKMTIPLRRRYDTDSTINQIPIRVDETPLRIQGRVGASLYRSARAAGVPARAVEALRRNPLVVRIEPDSGMATQLSSETLPRGAVWLRDAGNSAAEPQPGKKGVLPNELAHQQNVLTASRRTRLAHLDSASSIITRIGKVNNC